MILNRTRLSFLLLRTRMSEREIMKLPEDGEKVLEQNLTVKDRFCTEKFLLSSREEQYNISCCINASRDKTDSNIENTLEKFLFNLTGICNKI